MIPYAHRRRGGFTLLEVCIGLAIFALVVVNVHMVSKSGNAAVRSNVLRESLNDEVELTLDRISFALMGSEGDEIEGPVTAPLHSDFVRFTSLIGRDADGNPVRSATEEISWITHVAAAEGKGSTTEGIREGGRVEWHEDSDTAGGRRITWSNDVPEAYMGEVDGNGLDDNGNDLLDESGLAFARRGEKVEVFLTIERPNERGELVPIEKSLIITPRN